MTEGSVEMEDDYDDDKGWEGDADVDVRVVWICSRYLFFYERYVRTCLCSRKVARMQWRTRKKS